MSTPTLPAAPDLRRTTAVAALAALSLVAATVGAQGPGLALEWTQVLSSEPMWAVATGAEGTLVLAAGMDLHRSDDGGETWEQVWEGGDFGALYAVATSKDGAVAYAGGVDAVFMPRLMYSHDHGKTWEAAEFPVKGDGIITAIEPHPSKEGEAIAALLYDLMPGEVLRTTDGGKTWTTLATADGAQVADVAWTKELEIIVGTALGLGVVVEDKVKLAVEDMGEVRTLAAHPDGPFFTSAAADEVWRSEGDVFSVSPWAPTEKEPADHIAVNPNDPDQAWVTIAPGVLLLCVAGGCEPASPPAVTAASHLTLGGAVYAATDDGVWRAYL